jgi:hypothetical protein
MLPVDMQIVKGEPGEVEEAVGFGDAFSIANSAIANFDDMIFSL